MSASRCIAVMQKSVVNRSVSYSGAECHLTHKSATSAKICVKRAKLAKICVKFSPQKRQKGGGIRTKCPPLLAETHVYIKNAFWAKLWFTTCGIVHCKHIELLGLICVRCGDFMRHCRRIYVTNDTNAHHLTRKLVGRGTKRRQHAPQHQECGIQTYTMPAHVWNMAHHARRLSEKKVIEK